MANSLNVGQKYKVSRKFAEATNSPYLLGKDVLFEGIVKNRKWDGRDREYDEVEEYSFAVTDSEEKITCPKGTPMRVLYKLLAGEE